MKGSIRPSTGRSVVRIELEFDDGEIRRAEGEDAELIWGAHSDALTLTLQRLGRHYEGPVMQIVRGATNDDEEEAICDQ
jgi:hypothetical protein